MENLDFKNFSIKVYSNSSDCKEKVIISTQCHSSNFMEIITGDENLNDCDALITSNKKFKLGVRTADCASVCMGDSQKIGIIHIGWRELCGGLYEKVSNLFDNENLEVYIGPFMHKFEVQKDFCYERLKEKFDGKFFEYNNSKIYFDFKGALLSLMPQKAIIDSRNTFKELSLPSYRRDKTKNRLLTVISFK